MPSRSPGARRAAARRSQIGVDIGRETPKPVDAHLLAAADVVVILGREAHLEIPAGIRVERWETDEPSQRGIEGIERMRSVRDDIAARVHALAARLGR